MKALFTQILYRSEAVGIMGKKAIEEILATSRYNNKKNGICGMLIYREDMFVQLLEGETQTVHATYDRICSDKRHRHIVKLVDIDNNSCFFTSWSMAYAMEAVSGKTALQQLNRFDAAVTSLGTDAKILMPLLRDFAVAIEKKES